MKISQFRSAIYNKVWHSPKRRLCTYLRGKCDELPHKQRLLVVTVMLSVFILIAFIVFGHACYKMGAREVRTEISIDHIESLEIPKHDVWDYQDKKIDPYEEFDSIMESDSLTPVKAYEVD